jgi:hypothetical protein
MAAAIEVRCYPFYRSVVFSICELGILAIAAFF